MNGSALLLLAAIGLAVALGALAWRAVNIPARERRVRKFALLLGLQFLIGLVNNMFQWSQRCGPVGHDADLADPASA
jgi:hypothetical protein